ncbi:Glutathione peroxidase [Phytophthora cinnamomi]|uniref:Glutathione peroxidase n=1 Tax=Phytophthora cinnamomi TaxID=4785 RepID=UPI00355AAB75|nr:Glutathione peroxidase [Phytophthora cinnamomi]
MRVKQLFSLMVLLLVAVAELVNHGVKSDCNDSSLSIPEEESLVTTGVASVNFSSPVLLTESAVTASSIAGASSSGESSSSIDFPTTTAPVVTESTRTKQPTMTTQAPTETPVTASTEAAVTATTAPATTPLAAIETENATSSQSDQPSEVSQGARQSITATATPVAASAGSTSISLEESTSTSNSDNAASDLSGSSSSHDNSKTDGGDVSIAHPGSDSSTFQSVASAECSENEVDNVYTLYTNCRSAFDLCVSASDYQIFPYQGKHPTQVQIQGMAESDACIAMFVVVIEANFSACTIGGMPLVSAVETLLKISVDLAKGLEAEAPSADVFQELLTWRYEVDLAKAAGVPHDGSSELYAEFETNLDAALKNTTIRVNEDLSVDVRLPNGSYETFEDAIDFTVRDASAADMVPGYVRASSAVGSSSSSPSGIVIESSSSAAPRGYTPSLWSLVVAVHVVASAFLVRRV